jgi:dolichol-phosphate mannosyltransferase
MLLSIVIPVFNEADTLGFTTARLREALRGLDWEIIFVDDGSSDASLDIIRRAAQADQRIRAISFSRNFGHQTAITAGLDFADGDAVAIMDADLQDPPELLPRMLELLQRGYDIVSPQRISRQGETAFKRWTAALFYRAMARLVNGQLSLDVGDFRMFSRRAVIGIRSFRERHRFMRGLVAWLGLKEAFLPFERQPRAAGQTKYTLGKMLRFAWTAISSFSAFPLRISIGAGAILSGAGFLYLLRVMYLALFTHTLVPGWASIVVLQCFFSGMILIALGAIGDYIARIYEENKGRPLYVVADAVNCDAPHRDVHSAAILLSPEKEYLQAARRSA